MKYIKIFESLPQSMQEEFTFTTKVPKNNVDLDYGSLPIINGSVIDKDAYLDSGEFQVLWEADFDLRKDGINNFAPVCKKVWGSYTIVTPTEDADEEQEMEFDSSTMEDWTIELGQSNLEFNQFIGPQDINIDFEKKKILVGF